MVRHKVRYVIAKVNFEENGIPPISESRVYYSGNAGDYAIAFDGCGKAKNSKKRKALEDGHEVSDSSTFQSKNQNQSTTCSTSSTSHKPPQLTTNDIYQTINTSVKSLYGDIQQNFNSNNQSLQIKAYDPITNLVLLKTCRDNATNILSSLTLITHIKQIRLNVQVLGIAGSSRTAISLVGKTVDSEFRVRGGAFRGGGGAALKDGVLLGLRKGIDYVV